MKLACPGCSYLARAITPCICVCNSVIEFLPTLAPIGSLLGPRRHTHFRSSLVLNELRTTPCPESWNLVVLWGSGMADRIGGESGHDFRIFGNNVSQQLLDIEAGQLTPVPSRDQALPFISSHVLCRMALITPGDILQN